MKSSIVSCLIGSLLVGASHTQFDEKAFWLASLEEACKPGLMSSREETARLIRSCMGSISSNDPEVEFDEAFKKLVDKHLFGTPLTKVKPHYLKFLKDKITISLRRYYPQVNLETIKLVNNAEQLKRAVEKLIREARSLPNFSLGETTKDCIFRLFYLYAYFYENYPLGKFTRGNIGGAKANATTIKKESNSRAVTNTRKSLPKERLHDVELEEDLTYSPSAEQQQSISSPSRKRPFQGRSSLSEDEEDSDCESNRPKRKKTTGNGLGEKNREKTNNNVPKDRREDSINGQMSSTNINIPDSNSYIDPPTTSYTHESSSEHDQNKQYQGENEEKGDAGYLIGQAIELSQLLPLTGKFYFLQNY